MYGLVTDSSPTLLGSPPRSSPRSSARGIGLHAHRRRILATHIVVATEIVTTEIVTTEIVTRANRASCECGIDPDGSFGRASDWHVRQRHH